jgi:hypothetical protein
MRAYFASHSTVFYIPSSIIIYHCNFPHNLILHHFYRHSEYHLISHHSTFRFSRVSLSLIILLLNFARLNQFHIFSFFVPFYINQAHLFYLALFSCWPWTSIYCVIIMLLVLWHLSTSHHNVAHPLLKLSFLFASWHCAHVFIILQTSPFSFSIGFH